MTSPELKREQFVLAAAKGLALSLPHHSLTRNELRAITRELVRAFVQIGAPEEPHNPSASERAHAVVRVESSTPRYFNPNIREGESIKPGNITIDMKKFVTAGANTIRDVYGAAKNPWIAPLAALLIWDRFSSMLKLPISEIEATVIWVMWMNSDKYCRVTDVGLLDKVNLQRGETNRDLIDQSTFERALETLEKMKCIERPKSSLSDWRLRESVCIEFR